MLQTQGLQVLQALDSLHALQHLAALHALHAQTLHGVGLESTRNVGGTQLLRDDPRKMVHSGRGCSGRPYTRVDQYWETSL